MAELYFEDVSVGQEVPTFQRTTDLMYWNRFAAVNDEFVPVHMDDEFAKSRGEKGVLAMGHLSFAHLHNMLRDWIGDSGQIKRVACQYRGINYKDDTITSRGQVVKTYSEGEQNLVDLEIRVENQRGEIITPGTATVALPSRK
ncbi:MAG: MaoC/PaaZ C-terminal domain-containing protein [Dehalococcoidia bacterium]|jgi:acyl dehydratase|nr:MaoC/PaaZ C-terminal domain-containing protein [Dehalococcoidia bacterium]MDP7240173.1 MaoC/PaaZ C-terminal domain-containing protein [Dehalococcoidia bacterium]